MLRAAVERKLEIVGEALGQLAKAAPELAERVTDLRQVVGFRNVLVHAYSDVQSTVVWSAVERNVPELLSCLEELLRELGDAGLH